MMGAGVLGLLAVLIGISLFQPYRITRNRLGQIAMRGVGLALLALTAWLVIDMLRRGFAHT